MAKVTVSRTPARGATETVIEEAADERRVVDSKGREIVMRQLSALEDVRFVQRFGGENENFQGIAVLVSMVRQCGEIEFTGMPQKIEHVENRYATLGQEGMKVVTKIAEEWAAEKRAAADTEAIKK